MKKPRILIAASGTGGHLIPALVLAERLALELSAEVTLLGSGRKLEQELFQGREFGYLCIPITGLSGLGIRGVLRFASSLPRALFLTRKIFRQLRPNLVIGIGGYASVPPVLYASLCRVPTVIHEAEKRLGLANRFLALLASRITLAHEGTTVPFQKRARFVGQPTRGDLLSALTPPRVDADTLPERILILGGSQGASFIDELLPALVHQYCQMNSSRSVSVWHQARSENLAQVKERYDEAGIEARVAPFIHDMAEAYNWSDVIVSRSGAGSVTEIAQTGRPAIFIPYPSAADNHQRTNALPIVDAGRGILVEESAEFPPKLLAALGRVMSPEGYREMSSAKVDFDSSAAAGRFVSVCRELLGLHES